MRLTSWCRRFFWLDQQPNSIQPQNTQISTSSTSQPPPTSFSAVSKSRPTPPLSPFQRDVFAALARAAAALARAALGRAWREDAAGYFWRLALEMVAAPPPEDIGPEEVPPDGTHGECGAATPVWGGGQGGAGWGCPP